MQTLGIFNHDHVSSFSLLLINEMHIAHSQIKILILLSNLYLDKFMFVLFVFNKTMIPFILHIECIDKINRQIYTG